MIVNTSIEDTARRLTELLATVDLPDSFLSQLLANYTGHVFIPHGVETPTTTWQADDADLEPSLSMQAENSELRSQIEFLKSEQQRLESEFKEAEARSRRQLEETLIQQQQQQQQLRSSSDSLEYFDRPSAPPKHFSPPGLFAFVKQRFSNLSRPSSSKGSTSTFDPFGPDSSSAAKSSSGRAPGHAGSTPSPPSDYDDSIFYAMRLQHEFDKEDRALSAQRAELAMSAQRLFVCGICLEEMPYDSIARPDPCGHTFCRECLRGHVVARLSERKFPVLCPTCTANKGKGKGRAGGTCREGTVNSLIIISHYVSLRGLTVPCPEPRTHRRAIPYLD
jgi:hypothetical protein